MVSGASADELDETALTGERDHMLRSAMADGRRAVHKI